MQISSRFTIALHIFACIDVLGSDYKMTSEFLASSIGTNPVIVRKLLGQLKAADLIVVTRGTGGCVLAKPREEISFLDIYRAVDAVDADSLFHFHENPNPACPVGGNIHELLEGRLGSIQRALEDELARHNLADLHNDMQDILARKAAEGERS